MGPRAKGGVCKVSGANIYVYLYICVCVCVYIYICIYVYIYKAVHPPWAHEHARGGVCKVSGANMYVYMCVCACACVCVCIYIYIYVYMYIYIRRSTRHGPTRKQWGSVQGKRRQYICIYIYVCVRVCVCIYIYIAGRHRPLLLREDDSQYEGLTMNVGGLGRWRDDQAEIRDAGSDGTRTPDWTTSLNERVHWAKIQETC